MSRTNLHVSDLQANAVNQLARLIVRWKMTVPAILTLESMQPLSFIGSQFMHVLSPIATGLVPFPHWDEVATLLEDRRGVDYIVTTIEHHSAAGKPPHAPPPSKVNP